MSKNMFFKIVTDPEVDPRKCIVGMACANQAINDGHNVNVFFASFGVKLLQSDYISKLDSSVGTPEGFCLGILKELVKNAEGIYCSTGSFGVAHLASSNSLPTPKYRWFTEA
jgi:predicted peroxiredoxin